MVIHELRHFRDRLELPHPQDPLEDFIRSRESERGRALRETLESALQRKGAALSPQAAPKPADAPPARPARARAPRPQQLLPPEYVDRRRPGNSRGRGADRRSGGPRRTRLIPTPFPDRRLDRSAYEQVFLRLVSGKKLKIGALTFTPIGMKGWYHALFRCEEDGRQRLLTIDQLVRKSNDWI